MATLLIVEDDKQTNEAICEYLQSAGHKIGRKTYTAGGRYHTGTWRNRYLVLNNLMDWKYQKDALAAGNISKEQYSEWKPNWPREQSACKEGPT